MTTTLKLKPELIRKIRALAKKAGRSPHAWMVSAIQREAEYSAAHEKFLADGEAALAAIDAGGPTYAAEDVHAYILAKAAGKKARRPRPIQHGARR
jgi:predicted transcriptional regulator